MNIVFFKVLAKPQKKLQNFRETKTPKKTPKKTSKSQKNAKPQKITPKKTPENFKTPLKTLFLAFFGASRRNPKNNSKKNYRPLRGRKTPKITLKNPKKKSALRAENPKINVFLGEITPKKTNDRGGIETYLCPRELKAH